MYVTLIQSIKDTLNSVTAVKSVYPYALREGEKIKKYPAVVFFPDVVENAMETESQNFKEYRFTLFVVVSVENTTNEKVATEILPNVVDKIIETFDEEWSVNLGTSRTWQLIDSGSPWTMPYTDSGVEMAAPLNLRIRTLTNV